MKLSQKPATKHHHVLLFGPPKSGKTQLAGQLAEEFNIIYFDLENGIDTLLKLPEEWKERVEVISLPDTRSYPIAIETMLKVIKGGKVSICEAHGKVSCPVCTKNSSPVIEIELSTLPSNTVVIVDSLTQLTNSAIAHITKGTDDLYKLQQDDWGNLGKLLDIFMSHVQQAPFHIVCISHETEVEMVDGKNKIVPTAGTRNFSRNTAKYFDEVIYCEVKNGKHVAGSSTKYSNKILTGSRLGNEIEALGENISLLPIFKGEQIIAAQGATNSPAKNAVSALDKLRSQMLKK